MIGTDAFQETPIVEVTRQITKHNYLVMDIADLPRVMKEVRSSVTCQLLSFSAIMTCVRCASLLMTSCFGGLEV